MDDYSCCNRFEGSVIYPPSQQDSQAKLFEHCSEISVMGYDLLASVRLIIKTDCSRETEALCFRKSYLSLMRNVDTCFTAGLNKCSLDGQRLQNTND